jgi:N-acetylglucosamine-6-phosphate deacetylase
MNRPGFVDLQANGLLGISFSTDDLNIDTARTITEAMISRGTAAYCPTVITGPREMYKRNLGIIAEAMKDPDMGPHLLGIHMEGPFFSPEPGVRGAHELQYIRDASVEEYKKWEEWSDGNIAILTIAPERPGAIELISYAVSQGCLVSLGHHSAKPDVMKAAVDAGAKLCTHLGNGAPTRSPRADNPLWFELSCDELVADVITDGLHVPTEFIEVVLRCKTPDRVVVVSDVSPLAGLPQGEYFAFGEKILIQPSGLISLPETGALGGSHSTMLECMNHLASLKRLTEDQLWVAGYDRPLALLGRTLDGVDGPGVSFDGAQFVLG